MNEMTTINSFSDDAFVSLLVDQGVLKRAAADRALKAARTAGTPLERTLLELGLASETVIYRQLADWLGLPFVTSFDQTLLKSLPLDRGFLERVEAVPALENEDGSIVVATSNPRAGDALASISFHLGQDVRPALCTRSSLRQTLGQAQTTKTSPEANIKSDVEKLRILSNDGPIVALTTDLVAQAVGERASDIHVEATENDGQVRFRIDGVLKVARVLSSEDIAMLTSRLKIMADLNISEKRRPQDGRAQVAVLGRNIDLRLSTLPAQYGESLVIRILDREAVSLDWDQLGFPVAVQNQVRSILGQASGIFLVAGPTGSGKTTTLYTALSDLASESRKIITAEDPIEYALEGVTQVQVKPEIDMTFARTLRAILRQDPDTILIGEIRDQETADIAVRAALVGRLVLSTVHTNDSLTAIDRLLDLGVPPYLLSATLRGVLSQRLARTLGPNGQYQGRTVVTELMEIPADAAHELSAIQSSADLAPGSKIRDFPRLSDSARALLEHGKTTHEELVRLDLAPRA